MDAATQEAEAPQVGAPSQPTATKKAVAKQRAPRKVDGKQPSAQADERVRDEARNVDQKDHAERGAEDATATADTEIGDERTTDTVVADTASADAEESGDEGANADADADADKDVDAASAASAALDDAEAPADIARPSDAEAPSETKTVAGTETPADAEAAVAEASTTRPQNTDRKTTRGSESDVVRAHETPIFAAMFAHWDGPAAGLISRNLHRADGDTMVSDAPKPQPSPEQSAQALQFQVGGERHSPVITASGELNADSAAALTTPLQHILWRRPRQVTVDLAGITAATPGGLRALLDVREVARAVHAEFWLRSPSQPVRELLYSAGAPVSARPKAPATHRSAATDRALAAQPGTRAAKPGADTVAVAAEGTAARNAERSKSSDRSKSHLTAATLRREHGHAAADAQRSLEAVNVQDSDVEHSDVQYSDVDESAIRARQWRPSQALRESLRRAGTHHPHGHGHRAAS